MEPPRYYSYYELKLDIPFSLKLGIAYYDYLVILSFNKKDIFNYILKLNIFLTEQ